MLLTLNIGDRIYQLYCLFPHQSRQGKTRYRIDR